MKENAPKNTQKEYKRYNNMQRKYVKIVKTTTVLVWVYASPDFGQIQQHFAMVCPMVGTKMEDIGTKKKGTSEGKSSTF